MTGRPIANNLEEHIKQIEIEKQWFEKFNLIRTGKLPSEPMNNSLLPQVSEKNKEYYFEDKFTNMICSLDTTNVNLVCAHGVWEKTLNSEINEINKWAYNYLNSLHSYIIHDIKRFIDDVISICWLFQQSEQVDFVDVDCIGTYLRKYNAGDHSFNDFDNFVDFFRLINDMDNAYKHHVSNNMMYVRSMDEARILALCAKNNIGFSCPLLKLISLHDLVTEFNKFYEFSFNIIAKY